MSDECSQSWWCPGEVFLGWFGSVLVRFVARSSLCVWGEVRCVVRVKLRVVEGSPFVTFVRLIDRSGGVGRGRCGGSARRILACSG